MKSKQKWLEAAYIQFAELGPEGLNIKALSKATNLTRSNFYYHFPDKEFLIDELLRFHSSVGNDYINELKKKMIVYLPDSHIISAAFKIGFQFHWQLFTNRSNIKYNLVYISINRLAAVVVLPKVKEYYNLTIADSVLEPVWATVTDSWYSRIDFNNFTADELCRHADDLMLDVLEFSRVHSMMRSVDMD